MLLMLTVWCFFW